MHKKTNYFWQMLIIVLVSAGIFLNINDSLATGDSYYRHERKPVESRLYVDTDSSTGIMHQSFSIVIPPGRNGLQPDLSLNYSSSNRNNQNIYGYGWSDNIPYIERIPKKGVDLMYADNYFYSSLSGELVGTSTNYSSKIETGSFLDYEYYNNEYWIVTDKQGTQYTFGSASTTRQDHIATTTRAYKMISHSYNE